MKQPILAAAAAAITSALALAVPPLSAQPQQPAPRNAQPNNNPQANEVIGAVNAFLAAIANADRGVLAQHMLSQGVIFVHNRMNPAAPRIDVVPVAQHLQRWNTRQGQFVQRMTITQLLIDGDMAQVWGPFRFFYNGALAYCGFNALSLIKTQAGWKVSNISFSMEPPARCPAPSTGGAKK